MQPTVAFLATDVGRLFRKRFEAASRSAGLTGPQWRLMRAIEAKPGATQIALANHLEVEPITAGRMIDRLARANLVERRADPSDRRAWRLYLTEHASPHLNEARTRADSVIARALVGFDRDQQEQLKALLERMRSNLCGEDGEPEATTRR